MAPPTMNPLTCDGSTASQSSYTTASISPGSNRLVIAAVTSHHASATPNQPTLSGCGLTWVAIKTQTYYVGYARITLFRAMKSSPSSGQVTISFGGQNQASCIWSIVEFDGVDTTGSDGENAVKQSASNSGQGPNFLVTLGAFVSGDDATYGAWGLSSNTNISPGSGFTEIHEKQVSGADYWTLEAEWKNSNDTSVDASESGSHYYGGIAIEVGVPPAVQYVDISDSGAGTDGVAVTWPLDMISDTGAGMETVTPVGVPEISDLGSGSDAATAEGHADISETGAGTDIVEAEGRITMEDPGQGTEAVGVEGHMTIEDDGAGTDLIDVAYLRDISDQGLGIDIVYRVQGEISLDNVALPHVLNIGVEEPSIVQDLPVIDALPYRRQLGKRGRSPTIRGWTDSLSTLETLRGYADGEKHLLILPTGDSMSVHITNVRTPENVEQYDRYDYELDAVEVID